MSTNPNNTYEEWLTAIASTNLNRQFSAEGILNGRNMSMSYARTLFSLQNEV